ncbi:MAG: sulfatase-like hydrolase/transferase [Gammaproteobacteria bacterium]|nr:sulfatase-like hydrolase/transferase [Gammaproteobacteria bacterium]
MNKPRFAQLVTLVLLLSGAALAQPAPAAAQSARPNVIFIMTDDAGYSDLASYGSRDIRTPELDRLAREGVRMTDFYANGPVCSPTRAGMISGRYQSRYGIDVPLAGTESTLEFGLPANGRTLPQLLKNAGYATALVGKWHLGTRGKRTPNAHGFEYFYGFLGGYIDHFQHTGGNGQPDFWENDRPITAQGYTTDLFVDQAIAFIGRNRTRPFFLSLQLDAPHWPFQNPAVPSVAPNHAALLQPYSENTSTRQDYVAIIERVDAGVGRLLKALDEAGLRDNTLVVYTNDNGGEWLSDGGPFFNRKGSIWEGGIRVPAIFRWPAHIPAGRVVDQVGITMDVTATILAVTGAPVPADTRLDGVNLMPVLEGKAADFERTLYWRDLFQGSHAVRSGNWKLVAQQGKDVFLYDLRADPGERHDMARDRPEVAAELWKKLSAWRTEVDAEAIAGGFRDPVKGSLNIGWDPGQRRP